MISLNPLPILRIRTHAITILIMLALAGCVPSTSTFPTPDLFPTPTEPSPPAATQTPIYVVIEPTDRPAANEPPAVSDDSDGDGCEYRMFFITDVTVPDNTLVEAGTRFTKTWRLRNAGTCPWEKSFTVRWTEGSQLGGLDAQGLPEVGLGEEVDLSVSLVAPTEPGTYTGIWWLYTAEGQPFAMLPDVRIRVPSSPANPTNAAPTVPIPTASPVPTASPIQGDITSYVYNVTPTARQIYLAGLARGNRSDVFSMVGDSITHAWHFMTPIGEGLTQLHDYDYLWPVIDYFSVANARIDNSFANPSLAMHYGWTSFDVLNPANGEPGCDGRSPLVCELEVVQPSVAIIMIGSNDSTAGTTLDAYQQNLDQIVRTTIDYGVIPILSTIPYNTYADIDPFNQVVLSVAVTYDIPWMEYHALMDSAPNRGLSDDGMHPSVPPDNNPANFSAENLQYGYTLRNLLAVQALYFVWTGAMY